MLPTRCACPFVVVAVIISTIYLLPKFTLGRPELPIRRMDGIYVLPPYAESGKFMEARHIHSSWDAGRGTCTYWMYSCTWNFSIANRCSYIPRNRRGRTIRPST